MARSDVLPGRILPGNESPLPWFFSSFQWPGNAWKPHVDSKFSSLRRHALLIADARIPQFINSGQNATLVI
jgi:hypothetical protein